MRRKTAWIAAAALSLAACATTSGPDIRVDHDPAADLHAYKTYGFPEEVGTDRAGYSTLETRYLKNAVNREMQRRGYVYDETDPDLLVNFFSNVREETDLLRSPRLHGYYGYRYGLYGPWPLYDDDVYPVTYKVGTVNIDIVDGERMQLVWEGVAEGRLTQDDLKNSRVAIDSAVAELFQRYSGVASDGKGLTSTSDS